MKVCPYCSEQIQDEAIKCKHCSEWLNRTRPSDVIEKLGNLFKSGKKYIEEKQASQLEKRFNHLYTPTVDTPFTYNNVEVHVSHIRVGSTRIELDEIFGLIFHSSSESINGISTSSNITFTICYSPGDRVNLYPKDSNDIVIANGPHITIGRKKEIEKIFFMFQLVEKMTVKYRLIRYRNEIMKNGFFNYIGAAEIYNNGDLKLKNGKTVNIKTAFDNGLVSFGAKFSGLKSSTADPYAFIIYPTRGLKIRIFNFELNSKIEIKCIWNKDCFDILMEQIIKKGTMIEV